MAGPRLGRLCPRASVLLLCDLQERFRHRVAAFPHVVAVAARVLQGCRELGVPVVVTEQRPDVLGPTVPELGAQDLPKHPKTCFSMVVPAVEAQLGAVPHLASAILCGIETQACILHTALDLLERGLDVHVVVDACSSRSQVDRLVALGRLRQSGAFLTTSESLLLLLLRDASHPRFKQVPRTPPRPRPATPGHARPRPATPTSPPPPPRASSTQPLGTAGPAHKWSWPRPQAGHGPAHPRAWPRPRRGGGGVGPRPTGGGASGATKGELATPTRGLGPRPPGGFGSAHAIGAAGRPAPRAIRPRSLGGGGG
ncbi:isochorismatase domain-containing protein 2 [Larus michahellis]|uniref:isochorismatase domain-containing protein 2 n=1 Tax=Larus michahellis TaxID=119627 RepID=UPI003D9AED67